MLRELLLAALLFLAMATIVITVATLLVLRQLGRRNRVSAAVRSDAPLSWLCSPWRAARLHRRLRTAVTVSQLAASAESGATRQLADGLEREAIHIDVHLAVVGRLQFADRQRLLSPLAADVTRVEQLARRLVRLRAESTRPLHLSHEPRPLDELHAQCARVEAARRELQRIDVTAGISG